MDVQITKLDGTSYFLSDYDIHVLDFVVESMEYEDKYAKIDGLHGRYLVDSVFVKRKIAIPCLFVTDNNSDYVKQRTLLYSIVQDTEPFYIRELRKRDKNQYHFHDTVAADLADSMDDAEHFEQFVDGKRYLVKLSNVLKPTQTKFSGRVELEFETVKLPFAESIGTSNDLEKREHNGMWSEDMKINFDDLSYTRYTFEHVNAGDIYYHGNVALDQFNMYAFVTIVVGERTDYFKWSLNDGAVMFIRGITLNSGDIITYDGVRVYCNGESVLNYAGIEIPRFKPGFNHFKFNQLVAYVNFDMRFYFK